MKKPTIETVIAATIAVAVHVVVIAFFLRARDTSAAAGERTISLAPGAPVRGALLEKPPDEARLLVRCYYDLAPAAAQSWTATADVESSDAGYFARCPSSMPVLKGALDPGVFSFNVTIRKDSTVTDVEPTLVAPNRAQAEGLAAQLFTLRLWAPSEGRFNADNTTYLLRFTVPDASYPNR